MFTVTSLGSWGAASAFWRHKRPTKPHHPVQCHLEAVEKSQRDCCYEQALSEPWWPTAWGPKGNRWSLLSWGCCLGTAIGCARGENLSNVSSKRHARKKQLDITWKTYHHATVFLGLSLGALGGIFIEQLCWGCFKSSLHSLRHERSHLLMDFNHVCLLQKNFGTSFVSTHCYTLCPLYRPNCCACSCTHKIPSVLHIHAAKKWKSLQFKGPNITQRPWSKSRRRLDIHMSCMQRDDDTQRMGDAELKLWQKRKVCPTCPKKWNQVWWVWCCFFERAVSAKLVEDVYCDV